MRPSRAACIGRRSKQLLHGLAIAGCPHDGNTMGTGVKAGDDLLRFRDPPDGDDRHPKGADFGEALPAAGLEDAFLLRSAPHRTEEEEFRAVDLGLFGFHQIMG